MVNRKIIIKKDRNDKINCVCVCVCRFMRWTSDHKGLVNNMLERFL